ncbi:clathrin heavy chain linker domain-containing protein 1 [Aythya fuligula]|uniref:Clathrin heavy chain linker domain-containing protein 1 n=1 Tax=Aythya fuligula TaxID=219594 RepID=A0A6J3CM98_AYTFU|nr:clathrin heavy chain linker domain-containing protein 1 [Aythya fuligula]
MEGQQRNPPFLLEKDRRFLESIRGNILTETEKVGCAEPGPSEERYIIYSNAFDKIIEYVSAYKNILTSIKQEYEAFITRIKNGQRNVFFLRGRLKALESESTALLYYRKRAMELEDNHCNSSCFVCLGFLFICFPRIKAIEKNSAKIENEILKIQNMGKVPSETFGTQEKTVHPAKPIPGLSVEESLSLDSLSKHLSQLDRRLLELKKDGDGKYVPRQKKTKLEQELLHLLAIRDTAEAKRDKLKLRFTSISLDVPSKMAEDSLEYFESFSELFSSGQYDAAATCAINSPGEILCNEEALKNLKSLSCLEGRNLPLLKYFDTLINASTAAGRLPNLPVTLEAIKCALSEKQLNLVNHWVTQQRLTFSEAVGDLIYDYGKEEPNNMLECLALAQAAYGHSGAYKKVALCLCKQGRIAGAVDYIQQVEHFSLDDYFFLLENCPSTALIRCLSQQWIRKPPFSSMGATILSFISAEHKKHGFQLLEEMNNKNALEKIILSDTVSTLEDWNKIAVTCAENKHEKLSQKIVSVLTSQDGVFDNSRLEDEKDTRIME